MDMPHDDTGGDAGDDQDHSAATHVADDVLYPALLTIYGVAFLFLPALISAVFGWRIWSRQPILLVGVGVAWVLLTIHVALSGRQVFGFYSHDLDDSQSISQISFYAATFLFALGSFTDILEPKNVARIMPLIILSVLMFATSVLPPVFTHTSTTHEVMVLKTVKAAGMIQGLGLIVMALSLLLHSQYAGAGPDSLWARAPVKAAAAKA